MHWLIQNFVRLLQTLIFDYYVEYERSLAAAPVSNANDFGDDVCRPASAAAAAGGGGGGWSSCGLLLRGTA